MYPALEQQQRAFEIVTNDSLCGIGCRQKKEVTDYTRFLIKFRHLLSWKDQDDIFLSQEISLESDTKMPAECMH